MVKSALKKEKWTLSFDPKLKELIIQDAREKGVYPVNLLEELVREKYNPYGYTEVRDSVAYVQARRKGSRDKTDEAFLEEIYEWQRSNSS